MLYYILIFIFFICYGSFLNVIGYRMIHGQSIIYPRSFCPHCKSKISNIDLIPILSWIFLSAKCRQCLGKISILYPFIEALTGLVAILSYIFISPIYWPLYFLFFSALIVTIRTDLEFMLISRYTTIFLIPVALVLSFFNLSEISLFLSILGALLSYTILWTINKIFYLLKNKDGIGEGDFELLAMIGSFLGPIGAWFSLFIGAFLGSVFSLFFLIFKNKSLSTKIPFGPWLALAAIIFGLFKKYLVTFI